MAAKFEFEANESVETSRSLFQRALRFLPNSAKLWLEYFRMELLCVELVKSRQDLLKLEDIEASDDAIIGCKVVEVVYKNALKTIKGTHTQKSTN
jgi:hypothetical protein